MTVDEGHGGRPGTAVAFHRRVLDHTAGAVLVVDGLGNVVYANRAMCALSGWELDAVAGTSILDHLHPDDRSWVAAAFGQLVQSPDAARLDARPPWASIHLRLLDADGKVVPIEVTGHGGLDDPTVGGIIYDIRPAQTQELLGAVLRGIAAGDPVHDLLSHVIELVAVPPLLVAGAVLQPDDRGRFHTIAATSADLAAILDDTHDAPWSSPSHEPAFVDVAQLRDPLGSRLLDAGFVDLWHVAVESVLGATTYRIIACTPDHHVPATGVVDRVRRAQELAGVVLLRSQTDEMLAHAASHDSLTRLPNRAGFRDRVADLHRGRSLSVLLYIDLDGFKEINDRHGHRAGDRVLEVIADRLRSATRPDDLVARLGGDEFVIVLRADPQTPPREQGEATAERIIDLVGQPIELDDDILVGVAASVGVAVADPTAAVDDLLADADAAMYAAKRAGGGRHTASR